jgi:hypothetical protein
VLGLSQIPTLFGSITGDCLLIPVTHYERLTLSFTYLSSTLKRTRSRTWGLVSGNGEARGLTWGGGCLHESCSWGVGCWTSQTRTGTGSGRSWAVNRFRSEKERAAAAATMATAWEDPADGSPPWAGSPVEKCPNSSGQRGSPEPFPSPPRVKGRSPRWGAWGIRPSQTNKKGNTHGSTTRKEQLKHNSPNPAKPKKVKMFPTPCCSRP